MAQRGRGSARAKNANGAPHVAPKQWAAVGANVEPLPSLVPRWSVGRRSRVRERARQHVSSVGCGLPCSRVVPKVIHDCERELGTRGVGPMLGKLRSGKSHAVDGKSIIGSDDLLSYSSPHVFSCGPAYGTSLWRTAGPESVARAHQSNGHSGVAASVQPLSWSDVAVGMIVVRSGGGRRATLEGNLLRRAFDTWMPQVGRHSFLQSS